MIYDVGIGWVHPADEPFVDELRREFKKQKKTLREVTFLTLREDLEAVQKGKLFFKTFINRSWDDFSVYFLLGKLLEERGSKVMNSPQSIINFSNKKDLHNAFKAKKLPLPETTFLKPKKYSKTFFDSLIKKLGTPFVIKPSYGGAGERVIIDAKSKKDIELFFEENMTEEALVQEFVYHQKVNRKPTWFRVLFAYGEVFPHWWSPNTHHYKAFGDTSFEKNSALQLKRITEEIGRITDLDLFSTEIVLNKSGEYVIVDYANFPIDLNTSSLTEDGIPEETLKSIVLRIGNHV